MPFNKQWYEFADYSKVPSGLSNRKRHSNDIRDESRSKWIDRLSTDFAINPFASVCSCAVILFCKVWKIVPDPHFEKSNVYLRRLHFVRLMRKKPRMALCSVISYVDYWMALYYAFCLLKKASEKYWLCCV